MNHKYFLRFALLITSAIIFVTPLMAEAKIRTHAGLQLTCAAEFQLSNFFKRDDPNDPWVSRESHIAKSGKMEITLIKTVFESLEGVDFTSNAKGQVQAIRSKEVAFNRIFVADAKIKGAEAKRLSSSTIIKGKKFAIESLCITKNDTLWAVHVVFESNDERQKLVEELLGSVALAP